MRGALCAGLLALALVAPRRAAAHDVRGETVLLDIGQDAVAVELRVPTFQLELVRGTPLTRVLGDVAAGDRADLAARLTHAVGAHTQDGRAFTVEIGAITGDASDRAGELVAHVRLRAPAGATARWFALRDDLLLGTLTSATVYVFVRSDLQTGVVDGAPSLLGYLHYQQRELVIDRSAGSLGHALGAVVRLGIDHIAAGTDHLLFLLVLLLPAPLGAARGRWGPRREVRTALVATAKIATAFTLGHSITLLIGVLHGAVVPSRVVESAVALSILVAAIHAVRPLFPGREAVVAALFGLVHGLAFAATLTGVGVDGASLAIGVLGFNLGVEIMQLGILLVTVPWLIALARHAAYRGVRWLLSGLAALAASAWLAERAAGLGTPIPALVERGARHAPWALAALALGTLALALAPRFRRADSAAVLRT